MGNQSVSILLGSPLTNPAGRRPVGREEGILGLEPEMELNLCGSSLFTILITCHVLTKGQTWRPRCLPSLFIWRFRSCLGSRVDCFSIFFKMLLFSPIQFSPGFPKGFQSFSNTLMTNLGVLSNQFNFHVPKQ